MSEEQLSALVAKLKEDVQLREKFESSSDLETALAIAQEAGFEVSKADWLRHQARQTLQLGDEELESIAGGDNWTRIKYLNTYRLNDFTCLKIVDGKTERIRSRC